MWWLLTLSRQFLQFFITYNFSGDRSKFSKLNFNSQQLWGSPGMIKFWLCIRWFRSRALLLEIPVFTCEVLTWFLSYFTQGRYLLIQESLQRSRKVIERHLEQGIVSFCKLRLFWSFVFFKLWPPVTKFSRDPWPWIAQQKSEFIYHNVIEFFIFLDLP